MLSRRSYEKEIELPQKKDFVCRKLHNDYFNEYPNAKFPFPPLFTNLGKLGKKIISFYIKDNQENEKIMKQKEEYIYKYYHSKPHFEREQWKYSNHIIKEFSTPPLDKIHMNKPEIKKIPKYKTKPFRRPKIYGDYFDKNIYK